MMVYLDKEPATFGGIFRDILNEREATYRSRGFMQGKRRERIRKRIIYFIEYTDGKEGRGSVGILRVP